MTNDEYLSIYQNAQDTLKDTKVSTSGLASLSTPRVLDDFETVKSVFPANKERKILTNGIDTIVLSDDASEQGTHTGLSSQFNTGAYMSAAESAELYLDAVISLKASHPELPVYDIHNHPKNDIVLTAQQKQELLDIGVTENKLWAVGKFPSPTDVRAWENRGNIVKGAIYNQDLDTIISYTDDWSEAANYATQIALDYHPPVKGGFDPDTFMVLDDTPESWTVRFAPEGEHMEGTTYVPFENWQEAKQKYNIDFWDAAEMMKKNGTK